MNDDYCYAEEQGELCFGKDENCYPKEGTMEEQTWTTETLQQDFKVIGFQAPYVVCIHKETGVKGSLEFQHSPRLYFNWQPHE